MQRKYWIILRFSNLNLKKIDIHLNTFYSITELAYKLQTYDIGDYNEHISFRVVVSISFKKDVSLGCERLYI